MFNLPNVVYEVTRMASFYHQNDAHFLIFKQMNFTMTEYLSFDCAAGQFHHLLSSDFPALRRSFKFHLVTDCQIIDIVFKFAVLKILQVWRYLKQHSYLLLIHLSFIFAAIWQVHTRIWQYLFNERIVSNAYFLFSLLCCIANKLCSKLKINTFI